MEKEIRDMNVKELKALAKERGIKRYYWLRKAQLIESLEAETPPTEAPETEIMEAPETEIMEAPETEIMEAPETEIMDEPAPEIMDEPVPEIKKTVLSPTKMENISRVSSLVGLAKKQADLVQKAINKFADWLINYIPEPIRRTVNTRVEKLKKEIKEILENKKKLSQQEVNTTGESSAAKEVVTNKTEIKLVENGGRVKVYKTTGNLNFDLTDKIMEKITPIIETRTKVIHAFSCVIYRGQGEIIEYSKTFKAPPGTFSSLDDIKEYIHQCEQKRLDLEDAETWSKAYLPATATYNSKGVYEGRVRFTSVSTKIILSNEPLLGCGPLPKWLADKKCVYAIDKIDDNLCFWRCLVIHQRIMKGEKRPENGCELQKLAFPYEWFDSFEKLNHIGPVKYEEFYSSLKGGITISQEEYQNFCDEFHKRGCETMKDWLKEYNLADVEPFIEALEKTREQYYPDEIDLLKYAVSIPGISMTFVLNKALKIKKKSDPDLFAPGDPCKCKCKNDCQKKGFEKCKEIRDNCKICTKNEAYEMLTTGIIGGPSIVFC